LFGGAGGCRNRVSDEWMDGLIDGLVGGLGGWLVGDGLIE